MKPHVNFSIAVFLGAAFISCDPVIEPNKNSAIDEKLRAESYLSSSNFTDEQIALGRALFYDTKLSSNNTISCASCHKQAYAFGDNVAFSPGVNGLALRNTLPLIDVRQTALVNGAPRFRGMFWDGRKTEMNEAVGEPIINHIEMGMPSLENLRIKLQQVPYYPPLFMKAFGNEAVTVSGIQTSLTAFISIMNSKTSRFEQSMSGQISLTASEELGRQLFVSKYNCASCHEGIVTKVTGPATVTPYGASGNAAGLSGEFANIGLRNVSDKGLALITGLTSDQSRFRIPTLENVGLTAPYMHDGSIATLEEVIDHYSKDIQWQKHMNIDSRLMTAAARDMIRISPEEKKALVDFMLSFTDTGITTDPRFSDPFKSN